MGLADPPATPVSAEDRAKWNARYAAGAYEERPHPSAFLRDCAQLLPPPGHALDVACGTGRNAIHLARQGWTVDAVDISPVALERARQRGRQGERLAIRYLEQDLDAGFAVPGEYDLIVNIRYVNLPLLHGLICRLRPGGALLVEQHLAVAPHESAAAVGPRNPAFRVAPGSLRRLARGLAVRRWQEGLVREPDGTTAALARLLAVATTRPAHAPTPPCGRSTCVNDARLCTEASSGTEHPKRHVVGAAAAWPNA